MGTNSDSGFRLKLMLSLFVIITLLYTSYAVFNPETINASITPDVLSNYTASSSTINDSQALNETYDYDASEGQGFIDMVFGLGSFLTFGGISNSWARLLINSVTTICFIGIGYTVYLFIRDWIPLI